NVKGTDGSLPLFSDALLITGVTAGEYYLAVSSSGNVPDPVLGAQPGVDGVFDPNLSHSGWAGFSIGTYVLNVGIQPDKEAPRVLAVYPPSGATLNAPPTHLTVQFSEATNLPDLAFLAFQKGDQFDQVYVQDAGGMRYYPRLESWDPVQYRAHFLM